MDPGRLRKREQDKTRRVADGLSYPLSAGSQPQPSDGGPETDPMAELFDSEEWASAPKSLKQSASSSAPKSPTVSRFKRQKKPKRPAPIPVPPQPKTTPKTAATPPPRETNVSINISLPELRLPDTRKLAGGLKITSGRARNLLTQAWRRAQPVVSNRQFIIWMAIVAVLGLSWGGLAINKHRLDQAQQKKTAQASKKPATPTKTSSGTDGTTKPPYTPVVPATKPALASPDGTRSRYDPTKSNYSFYDSINNKTFIVSEQQLPTADQATKVAASAAKNLKTNKQLTSGWGTVYVLNDTEHKSQTMVFNVKQMLIFIQSSNTFDDKTWTDYINALQ